MNQPRAQIGVFGGSGFTSFLDDVETVEVDTPYGKPSAPPVIGSIGGRRVAFIPRHGASHQFPPSRIPARANLWAMNELGVRALYGPCACGSLDPKFAPGDFVVCDQLIDQTHGRDDTYWDGGGDPRHVSLADPYDPDLRRAVVDAAALRSETGTVHDGGTVVVINGPRFATRAESRWYRSIGAQVINMTQYPEATLAAELGLAYATISLITDYDSGLDDDPTIAPVSQEQVFAFFESNVERVRALLFDTITALPDAVLDR